MNRDITVVDYGASNMRNVVRALEVADARVRVARHPREIATAERLLLPGVGAFGEAISFLRQRGLDEALCRHAGSGRPLLGICLGMQMLFDRSEEFGQWQGLGLIAGRIESMQRHADAALRIPHTGWSEVTPPANAPDWTHPVLSPLKPGDSLYFVHGYMACPEDPAVRLADCAYGDLDICAAVGRDNLIGMQFHPEKSGLRGLDLLRRFLTL